VKPTPSKAYNISNSQDSSFHQLIANASKGKQKQTEIFGVGKSQLGDGKAHPSRFHPYRPVASKPQNIQTINQSPNEFLHSSMATEHPIVPHGIVNPSPIKNYNILTLPARRDPQQPEKIGPIISGDASEGKHKQREILGDERSQLNDGIATSNRFISYHPVARYRKAKLTEGFEGKLILFCSNKLTNVK
jgi:hypothetical protein